MPEHSYLYVMWIWTNFRESDRDVVAAAASILIVSSVKVPTQTIELIKSEMHHQLPDQRINALLRFQVHDLRVPLYERSAF